MKVVFFAGGLGTRLSEETDICPKPMVEIGGKPILWHIMKIYATYGYTDFVVLTGYMSHYVKNYFMNYYTRYSDISVNMADNSVTLHKTRIEPWTITMLYTGELTMTGARLKKAQEYLQDETFMLTYGDGVSNIDIKSLLEQHKRMNKIVTMTAVQPEGRFGALDIEESVGGEIISQFQEKPTGAGNWVNGGFMVCPPEIFNYLPANDERLVFEQAPLKNLAKDGQLAVYKHSGFWRAMDTLKDKNDLSNLWKNGKAPWALWEQGQI